MGFVQVPFPYASTDQEASYSERPAATLEVTGSTTWIEVMHLAAAELGIRASTPEELRAQWAEWGEFDQPPNFAGPSLDENIAFIDFYRPGDAEGIRRSPILGDMAAVDRTGHVYRRAWRDIPVADAVRAADEGLWLGDPLRPYLVPYPPQGGDFWTASWDVLHVGLKAAWDVADSLAVVGGAWAALAEAKRRLGGAHRAIEAGSPTWTERGLDPEHVRTLLETREEWTAAAVAVLFDCTAGNAEGLLFAFGWRWDEYREAWVRGGPAALVLADIVGREVEPAVDHLRRSERLPRPLRVGVVIGTGVALGVGRLLRRPMRSLRRWWFFNTTIRRELCADEGHAEDDDES